MFKDLDHDDYVAIISIIIVVGYLGLALTSKPIPEIVNAAVGVIFGYYISTLKQVLTDREEKHKENENVG